MHHMLPIIVDNGENQGYGFSILCSFCSQVFSEMVNFQVFHLNADLAGVRISVSALKTLLH